MLAALLVAMAVAVAACDRGGDTATDVDDAPGAETPELAAPTGPAVVAHRGASFEAPEHTFAAYDLAVEQGADYIEQDLQLTADGVLVALHDDTLDRTARGPVESCAGPVVTKTIEQLRECDMGSWFNETYPERADPDYVGQQIPTMDEILERYGSGVRYYVEIKTVGADSGMEQPLVELLEDAGLVEGAAESRQVLVQSFSPESLRIVRSLAPELPLVQLLVAGTGPHDEALLDEIAEHAVAIGPSRLDTDQALVAAAHARCLQVHPYTVDDPDEMVQLHDLGVDGMFTNVPGMLRELATGRAGPLEPCIPAALAG